ncbi:hypothetical protein ACVXHA_08315 [Escherichia coli]
MVRRSAVYGSGAIGGVVNIITMTNEERLQINPSIGSKATSSTMAHTASVLERRVVTAAGSIKTTKGFKFSHIQVIAEMVIAMVIVTSCSGGN